MPIASASSGIVMPGRARTSSSACLARLPLPRGRPRRRERPAAVRATPGCGGLSAAHTGECGGGLLEAIELFDQWAEFTQTCVYFLALLIQEVSH